MRAAPRARVRRRAGAQGYTVVEDSVSIIRYKRMSKRKSVISLTDTKSRPESSESFLSISSVICLDLSIHNSTNWTGSRTPNHPPF